MPRFVCDVTEADVEAAAEVSRRVRAESFPEIEWEHSHVVRTTDGLTSYCVYSAPSAQHLRDHATAAGLPADEVQEVQLDLLP